MNLARIVASHLLTHELDLGKTILRHVPERVDQLMKVLEAIEVDHGAMECLARGQLQRLVDSVAGAPPFDAVPHSLLESLPTVGRALPGETARVIRDLVRRPGVSAFESFRRPFVWALEHIVHRNDGFEDAEDALFELACSETESYANNATGVWQSLFLATLSTTRRPISDRLDLLDARVKSGAPERRVVALKGLRAAADREFSGLGYSELDTLDEPWIRATPAELRAAKARAWDALLTATADPDAGVSAASRRIVTRCLYALPYFGLDPTFVSRIADASRRWADDERVALRASVTRHERHSDERTTEYFATLAQALQPVTLSERLRDRVSADPRHDATGSDAQEAQSLAEELVSAGPSALGPHLGWLESDGAARTEHVLQLTGQIDSQAAFLPELVQWAKSNGSVRVLPAYLAGRAKVVGDAQARGVIESWGDDKNLAITRLATAGYLPPTQELAELVLNDVAIGRVERFRLGALMHRGWIDRLPVAYALEFLKRVAASDDVDGASVALRGLLAIARGRKLLRPELDLVAATFERLASSELTDYWDALWLEAGELLCDDGAQGVVVRAAGRALLASGPRSLATSAWALLERTARIDPEKTWAGVVPIVETDDRRRWHLLGTQGWEKLLRAMPAELPLAWIGSDSDRAVPVARGVSLNGDELPELAAELLRRFKGNRNVVGALFTEALSVGGSGKMSELWDQLIARATNWRRNGGPEVERWAESVLDAARKLRESELVREELERRGAY